MSHDRTDFTPLEITEARPLAQSIQGFELKRPDRGELPEFTPGAHIEVRVPNGMLRKYSLCNDPAERGRYVIAVKRETDGRGASASLVDDAHEGDKLPTLLPPRNDFPLAERASQHIFVAGGIGITPIMSMVRHLAATAARFRLYYLTRSPELTAFREELAAPELCNHVVLHYDQGEPERAFDLWPVLERPVPGTHVYCCGPRPLLEAVRDMTGHWSPTAIHFESFLEAAATHAPQDRPFRVRLARSGEVIEVGSEQTILEALRAHGHEVPSSCESGTCGTCRTTLLAGDVEHRDFVLTDDEQATNVMVCISRARSDEITIDR